MNAQQVFIIGCPRSGTSALSWALASHPNMWTSAESDFLHELFGKARLWESYSNAYQRPDIGWLKKNNILYKEFASSLGLGVDALFRSRSEGKIWVDSTPSYTLMATDLAALFPRAAFLHIVRDGRAVVCSMLKSGFNTDWAKDFKTACDTWNHYVERGVAFEKENPERVLRVQHRELIESTQEVCQRILAFIGVAHSDSVAAFLRDHRINSSYDNQKPEDIRSRKDPSSLRSQPWKSWTPEEHRIFEAHSGDSLRAIG